MTIPSKSKFTNRVAHNRRVTEGYRHGRLVVVAIVGKSQTRSGALMCRCLCDCGISKIVSASELTSKEGTKSCGCLARETRQAEARQRADGLIGKRFNNLVVTGHFTKGPRRYYQYQCDCGRTGQTTLHPAGIRSQKGCGCTRKILIRKARSKNLTGLRFGRLIAIGIVGEANKHGELRWLVKCDCGVYKVVSAYGLRAKTRSCGCLKTEDNWSKNAPKELLSRNGHRGARASHYPDASEEEYVCLQQIKKMWKGFSEHVRQQRDVHEAESPKTDAALSA